METDEITIPQVDPVVVVHGVINPAEPWQFVILEESRSGQYAENSSFGLVPPAPATEGVPIEGALVTLTYLGSAPCDRPTVVMYEQPPVVIPDGG
jgi:hypothetical protein